MCSPLAEVPLYSYCVHRCPLLDGMTICPSSLKPEFIYLSAHLAINKYDFLKYCVELQGYKHGENTVPSLKWLTENWGRLIRKSVIAIQW